MGGKYHFILLSTGYFNYNMSFQFFVIFKKDMYFVYILFFLNILKSIFESLTYNFNFVKLFFYEIWRWMVVEF